MDPIKFDLRLGMELAGLDLEDIWWRYTALGGLADVALLADRISGIAECDTREQNLVAQVLNEVFLDQGMDTFPVAYVQPERPTAVRPRTADGFACVQATLPASPAQRARAARHRGAAIAVQAAALHLTAARLMKASGQLQYARQARQRAVTARNRAARSAVAA